MIHFSHTTVEDSDSVAPDRERTTDPPSHRHDSGPDDHLALIYETRHEQFSAIVPFVRDGLQQNERVMYVATDTSESDLVDAHKGAGIDVEAALDSGALTLHSTSGVYDTPGVFDADEMISFLDDASHEAVENDEYDRLRITAEMSWAVGESTDTLEQIVEYETRLNEFFRDVPIVGLCQYDGTRFSSDLLHDIIRAHPHQVYSATATQNFAYLPPDEFFEENSSPENAEEFVDTHLDRVRAHGKLRERNRTLTAIAESSRELLHGGTQDIVDRTVTTLQQALSPSIVAGFFYDEETDSLEPRSVWLSTADDSETVSLPDEYEELLWETFRTDESNVFSNVQSGGELPSMDAVLQSGMTFPLERYGVLFVGSTCPHAFEEHDVDFAHTVARSAHAALERVEHEQTLEEKNEQLRHVNRVNETIRRIDKALVQATTREEIETVVCERLADADSYEFVWVGARDPLDGRLDPRQWVGDGETYLDEFYTREKGASDGALNDDTTVVPSPALTALESGDVCTVQNVLTTAEFEAWRRTALDDGFHSSISIPLVHNDTEYGVLNVYGGEPNLLTEMEQDVLEELGATIAYAMDAIETKASVHTDRVTQVGVRITDQKSQLLRLADRIDGTLDVETVLPESDDELRLFFTVEGADAKRVERVASELASVSEIRQITERERGGLFEAVVSVESDVPKLITSLDAAVAGMSATPESLETIIELPESVDVRELVDGLNESFQDMTVTSIQRKEEPLQTRTSFSAEVEDRLTDRQLLALRLAYHNGYFEWPRDSNASEVARSLGVTQPTFNGHLRASERKVFDLLFEK